jgi:diguanylate cyclase (GGDEF)-like protein
METLNIEHLSTLQERLSSLTGLYLSLWGERGNLILPPGRENKIFSALTSSPQKRDAYHAFVREHIHDMSQRNNIAVVKGPGNISHFFAPLRTDDMFHMLVGGGIYLSSPDFDRFIEKQRQHSRFPLTTGTSSSHDKGVLTRDDLMKTARHLQAIFFDTLRSMKKEKSLAYRFRLLKTILSLLSEINPEKNSGEIYELLADIMLFLFHADSLSLYTRRENTFVPQKAEGRMKNLLMALPLKMHGILSDVDKSRKPAFSDSMIDILRLGFPETVLSLSVFPMICQDTMTGLLVFLNTEISEEEEEVITEICRTAGFILNVADLHEEYRKYTQEIDALNLAAERLNTVKEPEMLYDAILDTSVSLAGAEKGSLMLRENGASYLTVKAAKGIHKRLMGDLRIMPGEGIAGWVFSEGVPLIVDDIEKDQHVTFKRKPKYRTGSFMSIPLKIGEKTIGVLNISDKISGEIFSQDDAVLLRSFASYATIALDRANYCSLASQMRALSMTDSLTGLFNRRYFEERFYEELHRSARHNLFFSLAMIDIDDFKLFNDTEGHLAGDEILKNIAHLAKESLRVSDVIARFGGEEFAVIMPQTEKEEALLVAERIRTSVRELLPRIWRTFPKDSITLTIGVSTFPIDGKDRKELIRSADKALYRGKMEGKDRIVSWPR